LKELGDYLRETRESNFVGVEEAAEDLNISPNIIENIEKGNTRAFRDMFDLKEKIKDYAKYLGLDPEKVIDEFNDFLFEHTSKISLRDILEAEEEDRTKNQKKVVSPYTKIKKYNYFSPKNMKMLAIFFGALVVIIVLFLVLKTLLIPKNVTSNRELLSSYKVEVN